MKAMTNMCMPSSAPAAAPVVTPNPVQALTNPEQYSAEANKLPQDQTAGGRTSLRIDVPGGASGNGLSVAS